MSTELTNQGSKKTPPSSEIDESLTSDFDSSEDETKKTSKIQEKKQTKEPTPIRNIPIPIKGRSNAMERTIYTIIMLLAFIGIIAAGAFYCSLLIIGITSGIFYEIINLKRKIAREQRIQHFMKVNWFFFFVGIFFFYGSFLISELSTSVEALPSAVQFIIQYHKFISFCLWVAGFLIFVTQLRQGFYRYQLRFFGWTHLTIIIVVAQTSLVVFNLYKGIVWFILPALLVITNDIFAYVFGKMFGKTKLIDLSPNKTVEGFIGGLFSSMFFALLFSYIFPMFQSLVCRNELMQIAPFSFNQCELMEIFTSTPFITIGGFTLKFSPFQIHMVVLSLFASLIAPFGGFFASGVKRALQVKDFGSSIPGHGGITDRMDCQILMGTFTFFYINYVVFADVQSNTIPSILLLFRQLSKEMQQNVLTQLAQIVANNQEVIAAPNVDL